uniref:No apical meristem-associated C-terminal domain-containing protein n=1 Tax=Brassica oleracea var. oleracea TaxID=109376 RepID=A0A0D3E7W6_BRAOL
MCVEIVRIKRQRISRHQPSSKMVWIKMVRIKRHQASSKMVRIKMHDTVYGLVDDNVEVSSSQFSVFSSQATQDETPAEPASREKRSGQNENDVLKLAHEIFYNNHKKKFTLEHAWKELKNDQKWCELTTSKTEGSAKRRKLDDSAQSSHAFQTTTGDEQATNRPPGVKASKGRGKNPQADGKGVNDLEILWNIKKEDFAVKERVSRMRLLDSLLAKQELADYEEDLNKKLITELFSN